MKKLLLASLALVASVSVSYADTVVDFTTATPIAKGTEYPCKQTISGVEVTFANSNAYIGTDLAKYGNYDVDTNYLMLKGAATGGGEISFSVPTETAKITIETTKGGTSSSAVKVTLFAGDTKVQEMVLDKGKAESYTYELGANSAANTVYKLVSNGSKNAQIIKMTLVAPATGPVLSLGSKSLAFATPLNGTSKKSLVVGAENITGNITATCSNPAFTVPASFTVAEGEAGIEVSFTGTEADEITGNIVFKAAGAADVTLPVSAVVVGREGTEANPLTVSDVLALKNLYTETVYVKGEIADLTAANAVDGMVSTVASAEKNQNTNIVLKQGNDKIGAKLPAGETRDKLNIVDNPTNAGKTIVVTGKCASYFGAPGLDNTKYVSGLDGGSGVEGIEVEEAAPIYFNLQGVRVANPENGIFIVVKGGKSSKVAF